MQPACGVVLVACTRAAVVGLTHQPGQLVIAQLQTAACRMLDVLQQIEGTVLVLRGATFVIAMTYRQSLAVVADLLFAAISDG